MKGVTGIYNLTLQFPGFTERLSVFHLTGASLLFPTAAGSSHGKLRCTDCTASQS